jgi:hypothetical protein
MSRSLITVIAICAALGSSVSSSAQTDAAPPADSRDLVLAALGVATIECLGTVGPGTFTTTSGVLAKTFDKCVHGGDAALGHIDRLFAVQFSAQGQRDGLADHFVARWNTFTSSFPYRRITSCPRWTLLGVIDPPTSESVARYKARGAFGKENRRYGVASRECGRDNRCAVTQASTCAAGFGEGFIVDRDPLRGRVELDPAWWLTDYEFPEDECDPFAGFVHGFCTGANSIPGSLYGSLERAGDNCCFQEGTTTVIGVFVPIDCGGGFFCMTICMGEKPL